MHITIRKAYQAISNGVLADKSKHYGFNSYLSLETPLCHCPLSGSHSRFQLRALRRYCTLSQMAHLPMDNYVYPENISDARNGTAVLVDVLAYFDSLFVLSVSYEKYGHVQFSWGGGMEHQTASYVRSTMALVCWRTNLPTNGLATW